MGLGSFIVLVTDYQLPKTKLILKEFNSSSKLMQARSLIITTQAVIIPTKIKARASMPS